MEDEVVAEVPAAEAVPEQDVTAAPVADEASPVEQATEATKTFTQEELDAIVAKRLAREQRKWERQQQHRETSTVPAEIPPADEFPSVEAYAEALARVRAPYERAAQPLRDGIRLRIGVEQQALRLRYTGGAPVLLLNPQILQRLEQPLEIRRPVRDPATLEEALLRTRERIRDLTTQLHALDLLRRALELRRDYIEN